MKGKNWLTCGIQELKQVWKGVRWVENSVRSADKGAVWVDYQ
ncbi:hypothetical protein [Bacillus spizizenii]|nr:hypothetical protein [Bacillus spizizenii]